MRTIKNNLASERERGRGRERAVPREAQCLREGAGAEGRKSEEGDLLSQTQVIKRRTYLGEKESQKKGDRN